MAYSSDGEGLHRHTDPADQQDLPVRDVVPRGGPALVRVLRPAGPEVRLRDRRHRTRRLDGAGQRIRARRWSRGGGRSGRRRRCRPTTSHWSPDRTRPATASTTASGSASTPAPRSPEPLEAEAADLFEVTAASFDYYHRLFGVRYPFGEYHQAFVPDFNAGAMENPGCVTLRDQYIYRGRATRAERASRAGTVAHEMAHMWFGDLVTMRWWDDLWLNESFAEYAAHRCCSEGTQYPLWTEFGVAPQGLGLGRRPVAVHPSGGRQRRRRTPTRRCRTSTASPTPRAPPSSSSWSPTSATRCSSPACATTSRPTRTATPPWPTCSPPGSEPVRADLDSWARDWLQTSGLDTLSVAGRRDRAHEPPDGSAGRPDPHTIAVAELERRERGGAAAGHPDRSDSAGRCELGVPPRSGPGARRR